jgi:hypothetical protein
VLTSECNKSEGFSAVGLVKLHTIAATECCNFPLTKARFTLIYKNNYSWEKQQRDRIFHL